MKCSHCVGGEFLPQAKELKYQGAGRMEYEMILWTGASWVMRVLVLSVVNKMNKKKKCAQLQYKKKKRVNGCSVPRNHKNVITSTPKNTSVFYKGRKQEEFRQLSQLTSSFIPSSEVLRCGSLEHPRYKRLKEAVCRVTRLSLRDEVLHQLGKILDQRRWLFTLKRVSCGGSGPD